MARLAQTSPLSALSPDPFLDRSAAPIATDIVDIAGSVTGTDDGDEHVVEGRKYLAIETVIGCRRSGDAGELDELGGLSEPGSARPWRSPPPTPRLGRPESRCAP